MKMLKRSPQDRITASEALAHPYFAAVEEPEEEGDMVGELV
jgi:serine/threonine protein kinase